MSLSREHEKGDGKTGDTEQNRGAQEITAKLTLKLCSELGEERDSESVLVYQEPSRQ